MAALDVKMILSLVDKASGPAKGIMARLFGGKGKNGNVMDGAGMSATAANGAMMMLNRTMATFAAGAAGYVGFKAMIGGAIDLEAALTDVQKKVSMGPAEFAKLTNHIKQLARETPLAATEIAGLVAQAGQFGIANEDLLRFAQLGSKAAIAFEMSATQSADSLSQIKNSLKLNMDQLTEYADAINYVADSTGSSEEQLVDFVLRTGAGAMAAGIKPTDLLAIGSAMTEVGISSGRAGTSVNAMITKMSGLEKKKGAVAVLDKIGGKGYSKKLQKEFFENPTIALTKMLKLTTQMSRPDRAKFFTDLFGLETQDEANALAGNIDKVVATMEKLKDTSKFAGSVQKTFELFAATTEQQWKRFTNNVGLAASAMGAHLLPAINGSLDYLNTFFATAEGRVSVFDRLSTAANGFFNGLGYKGGAAEALSGVATNLKAIRDLIFGVEGDAMSGNKLGEMFHQWQTFGASLHDSPIATILDSLAHASIGDLGGGLLAASVGMGALSIASSIALAPLRGILGILKGIAATAYTLSGLRMAKWIAGLAGGGSATAGGGRALGWLAGLAGSGPALGLAAAVTTYKALEAKGPADTRLFHPDQYPNANNESRARTGNPLTGKTEPAPPSTPVQTPEPFSFGGLWRDLMAPMPKANAGLDAVKAKAEQTGASMQQSLNVTAAPVVDTSSIDAAIEKASRLNSILSSAGSAAAGVSANVGGKVNTALRQNLADGGQ
ncbi:phage tail tape measure protein [Mesorhizobium sp. M0152]|uniref:phage tail tape measure protein n=1 Tax=Mesorhizobium sp. M0152 TaxID=2956898 RepID=UPI00333847B8